MSFIELVHTLSPCCISEEIESHCSHLRVEFISVESCMLENKLYGIELLLYSTLVRRQGI